MNDDGWRLIGTKKEYSWCGNWASEGCLDSRTHRKNGHGSTIFVRQYKRGCFRRDCKVCHVRWLTRQAHAAHAKISKYSKLYDGTPRHIRIYAGTYDKQKISDITNEIGCQGGVVIYSHFERVGFRFIINPHYDVITFGRITVGNIEKRYGCRIISCNMQTVLENLMLILADTSLRDKHYTFIWFGCMSYSKLKLSKPVKPPVGCPLCGKKLVNVCPARNTKVYPGVWQGKFRNKSWKKVRIRSRFERGVYLMCGKVDSILGFRRRYYNIRPYLLDLLPSSVGNV